MAITYDNAAAELEELKLSSLRGTIDFERDPAL